jgi:GTP-binding protein
MEELGRRRGELTNMVPDGRGRVRLDYTVPSRGLIGFRSLFLSLTSGSGILTHTFSHWAPWQPAAVAARVNGVLVSNVPGKATGFALFNLQQRGRMMVDPGTEVYEGMIVGIHSRGNDLPVNPTKEKQLTNIRAAGSDENILLTPPVRMSLEQALEFIDDDELVEVTPKAIRVRKKLLKEHERRRDERRKEAGES